MTSAAEPPTVSTSASRPAGFRLSVGTMMAAVAIAAALFRLSAIVLSEPWSFPASAVMSIVLLGLLVPAVLMAMACRWPIGPAIRYQAVAIWCLVALTWVPLNWLSVTVYGLGGLALVVLAIGIVLDPKLEGSWSEQNRRRLGAWLWAVAALILLEVPAAIACTGLLFVLEVGQNPNM